MKKYILSCLISLLGLSACDYLDIVPDNTIEIESLFESPESSLRALSNCYNYMPDYQRINRTMSLAGDEFISRLDPAWANNPDVKPGNRLMRGFQSSTSPIFAFWNGGGPGNFATPSLYAGIRTCNIYLENIVNVPGLSEFELKNYVGQVMVLKAFYHFFLIRLYGPIVIVDKNLEPSAGVDEVKAEHERKPVEECFQYVIGLLNSVLKDAASGGLQEAAASFNRGQIDVNIAKALKAQVLLLRASPLFNGNSEYYGNFKGNNGENLFPLEYDPEKWKDALDAIDAAIQGATGSGKKLYEYTDRPPYFDEENWGKSEIIKTCYNNRYSIVDNWNDELIWGYSNLGEIGDALAIATQTRPKVNYADANHAWGNTGCSYAMMERFYSRNGVPLQEDKNYDYENRRSIVELPSDDYHRGYIQENSGGGDENKTVNLHLNREPRFYAWINVDRGIFRTYTTMYEMKMRLGEIPGGKMLSGASSGYNYYHAGIAVKKLVHPDSQNAHPARVVKYPIPILRLADLYLMYAEAYNEYHGPGQLAYDNINLVRKRAGLRNIEDVWADASVVRTVGKHLTKEGFRDIIQTERMIELCFEGHNYFDVLRWKRAGELYNRHVEGWNSDGKSATQFYQLKTLQLREFHTPKNYLFPIPLEEINKNSVLVQNPGY